MGETKWWAARDPVPENPEWVRLFYSEIQPWLNPNGDHWQVGFVWVGDAPLEAFPDLAPGECRAVTLTLKPKEGDGG